MKEQKVRERRSLGRAEDLTIYKFGKLTPLYRVDNSGHNTFWECKCDCGNTVYVNANKLKTNYTTSCGCDKPPPQKSTIVPGQRFGRLVTISKFSKNKAPYWKCQCDCGNIIEVKASNLKAGYNVSCGCYFSEQNKLDLTNQKFGKLTAIKPLEERDEYGAVLWECKCDCGNTFYATAHSLNYGLVQSCGCVHGASSKGEEKIQILLEEKNIKFQMQKTFDTCRFNDTNALARFDFYIDDTYLIEYDGEQHFKPVDHWGGEEKFQMQKIHDEYKNQWCKDNNIPLIRIPYDKFDTLTFEDLILETTQFRII